VGEDTKLFSRRGETLHHEPSKYGGGLIGSGCNMVYYLFFIITSLWVLMHYKTIAGEPIALIYCCIVLFFVINAFVTATVSTVHYRYQYRVFWVLPATNAIIIIRYYYALVRKG